MNNTMELFEKAKKEQQEISDKMNKRDVLSLTTKFGNDAKDQKVVKDYNDKTVTFFSYDTLIAIYSIKDNELIVTDYWNYSKTTLYYLKQFIERYTELEYKTKNDFENKLIDKDNKQYVVIPF